MATLKDWVKYSDDEEEQPVKREKIKKTSIKIKNTHAEDPEWKFERDKQKAGVRTVKNALLKVEAPAVRTPRIGVGPFKTPPPLARSRKIF